MVFAEKDEMILRHYIEKYTRAFERTLNWYRETGQQAYLNAANDNLVQAEHYEKKLEEYYASQETQTL